MSFRWKKKKIICLGKGSKWPKLRFAKNIQVYVENANAELEFYVALSGISF